MFSCKGKPSNSFIKDNITLFLTIVNKSLSAYAKKLKMAIMFDNLFHDLADRDFMNLLTVSNFDRTERSFLFLA